MRRQGAESQTSTVSQPVTGVGCAAGRGGVSAHQRRAAHRIDEDDGDVQEGATAAGGDGSSGGAEPRDAAAAGGAQNALGGAEGGWLFDLCRCAALISKAERVFTNDVSDDTTGASCSKCSVRHGKPNSCCMVQSACVEA